MAILASKVEKCFTKFIFYSFVLFFIYGFFKCFGLSSFSGKMEISIFSCQDCWNIHFTKPWMVSFINHILPRSCYLSTFEYTFIVQFLKDLLRQMRKSKYQILCVVWRMTEKEQNIKSYFVYSRLNLTLEFSKGLDQKSVPDHLQLSFQILVCCK